MDGFCDWALKGVAQQWDVWSVGELGTAAARVARGRFHGILARGRTQERASRLWMRTPRLCFRRPMQSDSELLRSMILPNKRWSPFSSSSCEADLDLLPKLPGLFPPAAARRTWTSCPVLQQLPGPAYDSSENDGLHIRIDPGFAGNPQIADT